MTVGTAPIQTAMPGAERMQQLAARIAGSGGEHVTTHAPFTGAAFARVPQSRPEDVADAYSAARGARAQWASLHPRDRARVLLRFHDLVLDRQDEVLDLIQWESGKARKHAFEEVADVALVARYYGRCGPHYLRRRRRAGVLPGVTVVHELRQPKGVVGVITPWNYPLALAVTDVLPALAAGNAVVHKPDTQTAVTALWAVELAEQAGLPKGLWQVVAGDGPTVGGAVVDGADYVCFTGSTATGREVARRAAGNLVGYSLELGGKNPMLVLADADLELAAEGAIRACFSSAGQLCISMERLYVEEAVREAFLDRLLRRVSAMRLGTTFDFTPDMGSLISEEQLRRVHTHVEEARDKGATVLAGGRHRPDVGPLFYEPTLLDGVTGDMDVATCETFGPVVSVYGVRDEQEAVRRANATAYGLAASVWTRDAARGRRIAGRIRAGAVNVNEGYGSAYASVDAPMGGMGVSGVGRRHGAEGLLKYTEPQTVASQHLLGFAPPAGMTYDEWARTMTAFLRGLKRLGKR